MGNILTKIVQTVSDDENHDPQDIRINATWDQSQENGDRFLYIEAILVSNGAHLDRKQFLVWQDYRSLANEVLDFIRKVQGFRSTRLPNEDPFLEGALRQIGFKELKEA